MTNPSSDSLPYAFKRNYKASMRIWATELADKLGASAIVDAFDVSADQFPPRGWRSPNVCFTSHDCFKPFPAEYQNQFDIVHLRFWLCIINDDVVEPLLENVLTLLKPGGYIQWFEGIPQSARVLARNGGAPTPACDKLVRQWQKPAEHSSYEWVQGLPTLFVRLDEYRYQEQEGGQAEKYQEQLAEEFSQGAFVDVAYACVVGQKQA
ncbi:hypothetical protein G7Y89_g14575 [Cudoniella acicularis]|uniref:Uncharacterized protein n=1 Tax=Cudoniella acicularis TaxID=354080 RepID=A0A8H4R183_9HELO|nr:hypothetical protein G7Y89_g14575 [Cudoniella acicularis]